MNPLPKRRRSYLWGYIAEYMAALYLLLKGYSILQLRYRHHFGEIDIIAMQGQILIAVEVKARASQAAALYSITPGKQRKIAQAANAFIAQHPEYAQLGLRFDVIVLTSLFTITHIKDVWRL